LLLALLNAKYNESKITLQKNNPQGEANMALDLLVNGTAVQVEAGAEAPLLSVLRDRLDLTGSKYGCGEAECGACTVLVEGEVVRSCVTPAGSVQGKHILTIEGLERDGQLHPLQQAFLDVEAFQCAYCTSGMIMSGVALLNSCPNPGEAEIISAMDGNICRCGAYRRISRAIQQAASTMQASHEAPTRGAKEAIV
jgi:aerobic-type carbon monoxide dehydrogenase small subunit (CoxS/CutS family)